MIVRQAMHIWMVGLVIGLLTALTTVATLSDAHGYASRTKAKPAAAKAPVVVQEPAVKLRYYGGPKSPMYP
jgi:hypothetical protein